MAPYDRSWHRRPGHGIGGRFRRSREEEMPPRVHAREGREGDVYRFERRRERPGDAAIRRNISGSHGYGGLRGPGGYAGYADHAHRPEPGAWSRSRLPRKPAYGYPVRGYHTYDLDYGGLQGPTTDYSGWPGYPTPEPPGGSPSWEEFGPYRGPYRGARAGRSLYEAFGRAYPPRERGGGRSGRG